MRKCQVCDILAENTINLDSNGVIPQGFYICKDCLEEMQAVAPPQRFYVTQMRTGWYQVEDARYRGKSVLIRNENGYWYCSEFAQYDDAEAIAQLLNNVIGGDE